MANHKNHIFLRDEPAYQFKNSMKWTMKNKENIEMAISNVRV